MKKLSPDLKKNRHHSAEIREKLSRRVSIPHMEKYLSKRPREAEHNMEPSSGLRKTDT